MLNLYVPFRAEIIDINMETEDIRTYRLKLQGNERLPRFAPGKFLMVGRPGLGEAPISLSGCNGEDDFSLTIRAVGRVTGYLARLQVGDELFCRGPFGRGWPLDEAGGSDLLLVAGGVGLAPLRPVIEAVAAAPDSYGEVRLAYGGREPDHLIFTGDFKRWRNYLSLFLTVDEVPPGTKWEHEVGLVTGIIDRLRLLPAESRAFVCGPEIMMRFVCKQLIRLGFGPSRIFVTLERRMRCGFGQCGHCQHGPHFVCRDGPVFSYDQVHNFPDTLL
jgi:NAD(P)H-flavin reductase